MCEMSRARFTLIPGGRHGQPERRKRPRRPVPERVHLVGGGGQQPRETPATPDERPVDHVGRPVERRRVRGAAAAAERAYESPVERRARPDAVPAPRVVSVRRRASGSSIATWVFAIVMLCGLAATMLMRMPLLGAGLVALGVAGMVAPPRRDVERTQLRVAAILSACGLVLVAAGVFLEL